MGKYRVFSRTYLFSSLIVLILFVFSGCGGNNGQSSNSGQVRTFPLTLVGQIIGGADAPSSASQIEAEQCQVQIDVVLSGDGTPFDTSSKTQTVGCNHGVPLQGDLITIFQDQVFTGPLGGPDSTQLGIFATVTDPFAGVTGGAFPEFSASVVIDLKVFLDGNGQSLVLKNQSSGGEGNTVLLPFSQGGLGGLGLAACDRDCFCRNADAFAVLGTGLLCPFEVPDQEVLDLCGDGQFDPEDEDGNPLEECDASAGSEGEDVCDGPFGLLAGVGGCQEDTCQCTFAFCPLLLLIPQFGTIYDEVTENTLAGDVLRVSTLLYFDEPCPVFGNGIVEPERGEECDGGDFVELLTDFGVDFGFPLPDVEEQCGEGLICGSITSLESVEDAQFLGKCIQDPRTIVCEEPPELNCATARDNANDCETLDECCSDVLRTEAVCIDGCCAIIGGDGDGDGDNNFCDEISCPGECSGFVGPPGMEVNYCIDSGCPSLGGSGPGINCGSGNRDVCPILTENLGAPASICNGTCCIEGGPIPI